MYRCILQKYLDIFIIFWDIIMIDIETDLIFMT